MNAEEYTRKIINDLYAVPSDQRAEILELCMNPKDFADTLEAYFRHRLEEWNDERIEHLASHYMNQEDVAKGMRILRKELKEVK